MSHQENKRERPVKRHQIKFPSKGRTKQSEKDACDINQIMARYIKTGNITHANRYQPEYGYASEFDFRESLQLIQNGQDMFDELPAETRKEFHNNPAEFLEFVQNPENKEKLIEMGLSEQPQQSAHIDTSNQSPGELEKPKEEPPP